MRIFIARFFQTERPSRPVRTYLVVAGREADAESMVRRHIGDDALRLEFGKTALTADGSSEASILGWINGPRVSQAA
jgi:hypothetical protein